jgi:hypothetical protein
MILQSVSALERHIAELSGQLEEIKGVSQAASIKDWYTTGELAQAMGVAEYTVRERWCNQGRIECQKDPATGKWRIPDHEFERLRRGGRPQGI